jgi:hypothetical protein
MADRPDLLLGWLVFHGAATAPEIAERCDLYDVQAGKFRSIKSREGLARSDLQKLRERGLVTTSGHPGRWTALSATGRETASNQGGET